MVSRLSVVRHRDRPRYCLVPIGQRPEDTAGEVALDQLNRKVIEPALSAYRQPGAADRRKRDVRQKYRIAGQARYDI